jgi:hypothetical protein
VNPDVYFEQNNKEGDDGNDEVGFQFDRYHLARVRRRDATICYNST